MDKDLGASARRVEDALRSAGVTARIIEMAQSTRTAAEAAQACGCEVGQIVKSLVFRGTQTGEPVLILAAGDNRVDETLAAEAIGETIERADARFVREATGFAIGGVAPVGHVKPIRVVLDATLDRFAVLWAAAGTPNAVFETTPGELQRMTKATVTRIC